MIKIKPKYGKTSGYNKPLWYCRNFNIVTGSYSREKCIEKHIEKLKKYGFTNVEKPDDETAMEFSKSPFIDKEL